jgi:hypothetical protein
MDGNDFIKNVCSKIYEGFEVLKTFQVEPPFIISLSMIGIKDGVISSFRRWSKPFKVNEIYLPPIVIPTFETNIYNQLKPVFDIIWQAVGENKSPDYQ